MQEKNKRQIGAEYERIAAEYLENKGYQILIRNYRNPFGEIDLVAEKDKTIVFCEIKYRRGKQFGDPLEAVDIRKQRRILKVALYYTCQQKNASDTSYRFDVIGIYGDGTIRQIENAFYFQK